MQKQRLLSGITATGKLTIGNYIGAIKGMIELQDKYDMYIFVADLHALTIDIPAKELRENKKNIYALYLACGLDPNKTTIFFQSDINAHGQMSWIIENMTTLGELNRMTQFKDKSQKGENNKMIRTGLLTYPALMAADILLYNPEIVPVGEDQKQHMELTRNIAQRINNKYGKIFNVPNIHTPKVGGKIMSLIDPTKKMSKSDKSSKSYIALLDNPEQAAKKIRKAVTDSINKIRYSDEQPGIKNLINIYSSLTQEEPENIVDKYKDDENYGNFKVDLANIVEKFLVEIQLKYNDALKHVDDLSKEHMQKAELIALGNLNNLKKHIGLK